MATVQLSQKNNTHAKLSESSLSLGGTSSQSLGQPSQVPVGPQSKFTELGCRAADMAGGYRFPGSGLKQRVDAGRGCVLEDLLGFMAYPWP